MVLFFIVIAAIITVGILISNYLNAKSPEKNRIGIVVMALAGACAFFLMLFWALFNNFILYIISVVLIAALLVTVYYFMQHIAQRKYLPANEVLENEPEPETDIPPSKPNKRQKKRGRIETGFGQTVQQYLDMTDANIETPGAGIALETAASPKAAQTVEKEPGKAARKRVSIDPQVIKDSFAKSWEDIQSEPENLSVRYKDQPGKSSDEESMQLASFNLQENAEADSGNQTADKQPVIRQEEVKEEIHPGMEIESQGRRSLGIYTEPEETVSGIKEADETVQISADEEKAYVAETGAHAVTEFIIETLANNSDQEIQPVDMAADDQTVAPEELVALAADAIESTEAASVVLSDRIQIPVEEPAHDTVAAQEEPAETDSNANASSGGQSYEEDERRLAILYKAEAFKNQGKYLLACSLYQSCLQNARGQEEEKDLKFSILECLVSASQYADAGKVVFDILSSKYELSYSYRNTLKTSMDIINQER